MKYLLLASLASLHQQTFLAGASMFSKTSSSSSLMSSTAADSRPSLSSTSSTILLDQTTTTKEAHGKGQGFMGDLSGAASSMAGGASSMAGAVAGQAMNSMYDKPCVMCEYILEQVDKMIKAQPRMMNGNGYYPGVMDFGGGVQQGNYRTYQGTYLEESETTTTSTLRHGKKTNSGSKPTTDKTAVATTTTAATTTGKTAVATTTAATTAATTEAPTKKTFDRSATGSRFGAHNGVKRDARRQNRHKSRSSTAPRGRFTPEQRKIAMSRFQESLKTGQGAQATLIAAKSSLFSGQAVGASKGGKGGKGGVFGALGGLLGGGATVNRVNTGRHTFKDMDLTDDQVEKDQEFSTMYKDFMDAMDDVCFHDFPKDFQQYCKNMYYYGDRVVEMYLHDYDDFEICAQTPMQCIPTWFDEGAKPLWRR
jgi:hypothetical protein